MSGNGNGPTFEDARSLLERDGKHPVFLHIKAREKGPVWKGWSNVTYDKTLAPEYQSLLQSRPNTGVLLGKASDDLCAVDFDTEASLEAFLQLNPEFQSTWRTRGERGAQLWAYIHGVRPSQVHPLKVKKESPLCAGMELQKDTKTGEILEYQTVGEFRAEGGQSVIRGIHPSGCNYTWTVANPPITIAFDHIRWPNDVVIPWGKSKRPQTQGPDDGLLDRAIEKISIDFLWRNFGFPERRSNPVHSPFHPEDKETSFSVYDEGRRFKDHDPAYHHHRGDSYDFYQLHTGLESGDAFVPFVELAGLGHELRKNEPKGSTKQTSPVVVEEAINWENSTNSTNLPGGTTQIGYIQPCIYPQDSILSDYMQLAHEVAESADPFLLGACLPGIGALLGRRIRFPFGHEIQFPNLFNMLAGPPGTRKSSAIEFSNGILRGCLPKECWMSKRFSVETLFDEYDQTRGGSPDKLWVYSDAKPILTDWKKTSYGERVAAEVLDLYDCRELTENFRRNASKKNPQTKRYIPQTSTSLVFGATFGDASFPGQAVQSGIARRFLFHVAEDTGRDRDLPPVADVSHLVELFSRVRGLQGACTLSREAEKLWKDFHHDNKVRIRQTNSRCEAEIHRLNSAPMQTLHTAMIFEACILAKQNKPGFDKISLPALSNAIGYVDACLDAAKYLDSVSNQCDTVNDAEILLAKIRKDFQAAAKSGSIILTRSQITATYAPHSSRQGSWTPDVIFLKLVPELIREGNAKLYEKRGKATPEKYAFRFE